MCTFSPYIQWDLMLLHISKKQYCNAISCPLRCTTEPLMLLQCRIYSEIYLNPTLAWCSFLIPYFSIAVSFETLHRARQWYCRALCKISKRYDNPNISNGGAMIRETWVDEPRDESQRGIFLLQHLPVGALMAPGQNLQNGIHLIMVIGQWHLRVSQGWHMAIQNIRTS